MSDFGFNPSSMKWTEKKTLETTTLPTRLKRQPISLAIGVAGLSLSVAALWFQENGWRRNLLVTANTAFHMIMLHRAYDLTHWKRTQQISRTLTGTSRESTNNTTKQQQLSRQVGVERTIGTGDDTLRIWDVTPPSGVEATVRDAGRGHTSENTENWQQEWRNSDGNSAYCMSRLCSLQYAGMSGLPRKLRNCRIPTSLVPTGNDSSLVWCVWTKNKGTTWYGCQVTLKTSQSPSKIDMEDF